VIDLRIFDTPEDAARAAAELLAGAARAKGHVALAGGSTPRRAYQLAAELEQDWSGATAWLGDERCVPQDDRRSNTRLVRESLLDALPAPPDLRRPETELGCEEAADRYDRMLTGLQLDVALQGLGPDGHTASLFPNAPTLDISDRRTVVAAPGLEPWVERVTMTLPMLATARLVVFLAVGADKADAAARAFADGPSKEVPASLLRSARGRTVALLDRAAAAKV
jgi:6-phosphogluconolactonase